MKTCIVVGLSSGLTVVYDYKQLEIICKIEQPESKLLGLNDE